LLATTAWKYRLQPLLASTHSSNLSQAQAATQSSRRPCDS
jgi:hypothetical protein